MSIGKMIFFGGLVGSGITIIASIITITVLARARKRLKNKIDDEYGGNLAK